MVHNASMGFHIIHTYIYIYTHEYQWLVFVHAKHSKMVLGIERSRIKLNRFDTFFAYTVFLYLYVYTHAL